MKFGIVALSLGVILVAPIVVAPGSSLFAEEGLVGDMTAPHASVVHWAASPEMNAATTKADTTKFLPSPAPPTAPSPPVREELEVSVSCGQDGCVITNGLEVTVLESAR